MVHAQAKVLLPNLTQLDLTTESPSENQLVWIRAFLSPSLEKIRVFPPDNTTPFISYIEASKILGYIISTCPRLKVLYLYPKHQDPTQTTEGFSDAREVIDFWDSSMPLYLSKLHSLIELDSTTELLTPSNLPYLSQLPHLETLLLHPSNSPFLYQSHPPPNSFRSLRSLTLARIPYTLFTEIWRLQIFDQLTYLSLVFTSLPEGQQERGVWSSNLVSLICDTCLKLANLRLDFDRYDQLGWVELIPSTFIPPMKALSLTFLELRCAYLSEEGVSTAYSMMPMAWSTITNLSLDEFHVTEKELHWFTELPVLEELTVELSVSQPPTPDSTESISQRNTSFKTLRSSHDVDIKGDIHQIAR
ncbi:hypothetical protein RhiJN_11321 [Ceratobasidium sp. AG-Ba]|nr:hypothetical protein RhiJN_11321 [Ceratobasidium sp. AG-Ba]